MSLLGNEELSIENGRNRIGAGEQVGGNVMYFGVYI